MTRVRMLVAYDGSGFAGFAPNPGVDDRRGHVGGALERVLRHPTTLTCAGRTDAGVHAWGQVVTFDTELDADALDLAALQRSVNGMCGPKIVVRDLEIAPDDFDARHSALCRRYRYTVLNRPVPDPFLAATTWHVAAPLDLAGMRLGCDPFIGEHDFTSFCRKVPDRSPRAHRALGRVGRPGRRAAPVRDRGDVVLPADGAGDRRHARRGRAGQEACGRRGGDPAGAQPGGGRRAGSSPRADAVGGRLSRSAALLGAAAAPRVRRRRPSAPRTEGRGSRLARTGFGP